MADDPPKSQGRTRPPASSKAAKHNHRSRAIDPRVVQAPTESALLFRTVWAEHERRTQNITVTSNVVNDSEVPYLVDYIGHLKRRTSSRVRPFSGLRIWDINELHIYA